MSERYDIYFSGQLAEGRDIDSARAGLARLFQADEATLDKLFSGKAHIIKRDCDRATALKYKQAMEEAGAQPLIQAAGQKPGTRKPAEASSASDKIAALATAPDELRYRENATDEPATAPTSTPTADADSFGLTPPGTEVLRDDERPAPVTREIDTSRLHVDSDAERLSEASAQPPADLDTDHLSMAEVGEDIPNLPSPDTPVNPDLEGLSLAEAGKDLSDCAPPEAPAPALDLSSLSVEPPGTEMLEEQFRKRDPDKLPDTDHISLED